MPKPDDYRNTTPMEREARYGDSLRPYEPTAEEARKAVFDATNAWPYERGEPAPDAIAREVPTYVEDERRPPMGKFEFAVIVAFVVVVLLGAAYLFGGAPK